MVILLRRLKRLYIFQVFRDAVGRRADYGNSSKGGRPPFDTIAMFKNLIIVAQQNLPDARMQFIVRDRLSWMRFIRIALCL